MHGRKNIKVGIVAYPPMGTTLKGSMVIMTLIVSAFLSELFQELLYSPLLYE